MKTKCFPALLVAVCLSCASFAAQAQTARIAYLSHGGSPAGVVESEAADNFGLPTIKFFADTIVATSDTTAVAHGRLGRWQNEAGDRSTRTINYGKHAYQQATATGPQSRGTAVRLLQQRYPDARLVGFDTLAKPAAPATPPLKKRKTKRKQQQEGAVLPMLPPTGPPQHPGVWLALAVIIGLGTAGLFLHEKSWPTLKRVA